MTQEYLVFRLYGPMCSWGDIAVGEVRPSTMHPSKSAILGLVAAALGLKRPDTVRDENERTTLEVAHSTLAHGYGFAVRVDAPGYRWWIITRRRSLPRALDVIGVS